jgi:hypothetical protein
LRSGFEPAVIALVLRTFCLLFLACERKNDKYEEKERSAEGRSADRVSL